MIIVQKLPDVTIRLLDNHLIEHKRLNVPQFQRKERSGIVTMWSVSDWEGELGLFDVNGASPGTLHIHRNRSKDHVHIWMKLQEGWVDCTQSWLVYTTQPKHHPQKAAYVLDAHGTETWTPSYIAISTRKSRHRVRTTNLVEFNKASKLATTPRQSTVGTPVAG